MGLSFTEIKKKGLCKSCDLSICNNDYNKCPYRYDKTIVKLCLVCEDLNNEIVDGMLKCYHTCKYRTQKKMDRWFNGTNLSQLWKSIGTLLQCESM